MKSVIREPNAHSTYNSKRQRKFQNVRSTGGAVSGEFSDFSDQGHAASTAVKALYDFMMYDDDVCMMFMTHVM